MKVISLGAGVQSTALLLMSIPGEIERADCAIFADTGWEPFGVYELLNHLRRECEKESFPLHVVSKGDLRQDTLDFINDPENNRSLPSPPVFSSTGSPFLRTCTKDYKINPIRKKVRQLLGIEGKKTTGVVAEMWFGISTDEIQRMKYSNVKWLENKYPLIDLRMDRNNCQKWLDRNWKYPVSRSACIGCPYHSNALWRQMKKEQPDEWADAVEWDKDIRKHPWPGANGEVFIHRSCKPLDEVDLTTAEDHGQMSFLDECEGMCGV